VVQPGQTIQVASGTYPESVTVNKAGTATAPIVLTTAPGASVTITGDGTSARALTVSAPYVQVNGFSVLSPTKQDVYVSASNVAMSDLSVSRTSSHGIYVSGSSGAPVSNVTLTGNVATVAGLPNIDYSSLAAGIYLKYATNSTVTMNTADADTLAGIYLGTGTANITVAGNVTFNNAAGRYSGNTHGLAPGIDTRSGPNLIIRNLSYSNEDSGLQFYTGAHDNVVTNNLSFNNGDHGIDDLNAPNQIIVGNTIYNNFTAGINLEGSSPGGTVENNLSVNNGLNSTRTTSNIRVDSTSISGAIVDYNDVRVPQQKVCGTNFTSTCTEYIWGKTGYSSLASFQAATGQEAHGKEADPLFMARDNGDFRLQAGSPAIDDANSAVAGWQATDYAANLRVDDPTTPNTGVGPRSYDDRGALEYQPTQSGSPPTASLAVTPSSGIAPLAVTADASASTAGSAAIATYAFDFGDGSAVVGPQSGANTGHTYGSAGTYTAKVTVTDAAGESSTATSQVAVTSSSPPNLVGNPGFETNTAGWNTSGSGSTVTLTRVSGGHSGGWSAALANTGTVSGTCALNDSPNWVTATAAGTYTGSLWVRADMPGAPLTLRFREYQGSTLVGSKTATVTLTTTWQQIQVTYMPLAPGLSTLDFNAYVPAAFAPPGSCFYADDAAITTG
jgi:parallel beta-helix repeat protein